MHEIERFLQDFHNGFALLRASYRFDSCWGCQKRDCELQSLLMFKLYLLFVEGFFRLLNGVLAVG